MKLFTYKKIDKLTRSQTMTTKKTNKNQVNKKAKNQLTSKLLSLALILIMVIISLPKMALAQLFGEISEKVNGSSNATIKLPDTQYVENTVDLRVKVLGGEVKLNRTWTNGRWYINPAWVTLRFVTDPLGNITAIDRAGTIYQLTNKGQLVSNNKDNNANLTQVKKAIYSFEQVYIRQTDTGWHWHDLQGNWINYDKEGRILEYGDKNNIKVSFILDKENRRTAIKDHHGEVVYTFSYDDQDHLVKVIDREGRTVSYEWSGDRLTQVTDVLGNKWLYGYDANGQLNQRTEPDGGIIKIDYSFSMPAPKPAMNSGKDGGEVSKNAVVSTASANRDSQLARVAKITDKTGAVTIYNTQYNRINKQYTISIDDPMGKKTVSQFDAKGRILTKKVNDIVTETYQRDDKNYLVKYIDQRGLTTEIQYNQGNKPLKITYPNNAFEDFVYNESSGALLRYKNKLGVVTTWDYDNRGNLIKVVDALDKPEQTTYQWLYDEYGQPVTITYNEGDNIVDIKYQYDKQGNISKMIDSKGYIYQYNYNIMGQLTSTTNPLNANWITTYNEAGYIVKTQDPLNHVVTYETDYLGRVIKLIDPLGNETQYIYKFDSSGSTITYIDALNQITKKYYDTSGRVTKASTPSGLIWEQEYDRFGRGTKYTDIAGNSTLLEYGDKDDRLSGLLIKVTQPTFTETYNYNSLGLKTQINKVLNDKEKLTTYISYDQQGNLVSFTDAAKHTNQIQYNAFNKQSKHIDPLGNETTLTWNALGNITSVLDANGKTYYFEYDQNANPIKKTKALGGEVIYHYDQANRLIEEQDASGNIISYQYDLADRLITKKYSKIGQSNIEQTVSYRYDAANHLLEVTQVGNTYSNFVYTRDKLGRIVKETISYGNGSSKITKILQYSYTPEGSLASITYPDNSVVTFSYQNGRLKHSTLANGEEITWDNYQWKKPTEIHFPNTTQFYQYDALQRPLLIKLQTNNQILMERHYQYDKAGNVSLINTEQGNKTYQYDLLDRLTSVIPDKALQQQGLPIEGYNYDAIGNRIGSINQSSEWVYNDNNQLVQWSKDEQKTDLTYTANGHIATEVSINQRLDYSYNATDRLAAVTKNGKEIANYLYDPFGRRISKSVNGVITYYIYSKEGLLVELDEQGNLKVAYGWQPNTEFGTSPLWQANVKNNDLTTSLYNYLHTDHLNTVQLATTSQGQISWQGISDAFGKTILNANNQITMNLRFPGQYFDQEANLNYNYFRNYNFELGRYLQADPIGLEGGWNPYTYVSGNPINRVDPMGLLVGQGLINKFLNACGSYIADKLGSTNPFDCTSMPIMEACVACCTPRDGVSSQCRAECAFRCLESTYCLNYEKWLNSLPEEKRKEMVKRAKDLQDQLTNSEKNK